MASETRRRGHRDVQRLVGDRAVDELDLHPWLDSRDSCDSITTPAYCSPAYCSPAYCSPAYC